jgi:four helix bundle protein
MLKSYKNLIGYQKAYSLSLQIYKVTKDYPQDEKFGLISQMRRSAVSIPCNIAEGYSRKNIKEYLQFLHVAYGSCSELETLISLSQDLGLLNTEKYARLNALQEEVSKLINGLMKALTQKKEGKNNAS